MWPSYMPIPLTEKCSAKLETLLHAHAKEIYMNESTLICLFRSRYGSFGGFVYQAEITGIASEIEIEHESGDAFAVYYFIHNFQNRGHTFTRHAGSFAYPNLIKGIAHFLKTGIEEANSFYE
jgi:hypothetical protein